MKRFLAIMLVALLWIPTAFAQEDDTQAFIDDAKTLIEQVLAGDVDAYYDRLSEDMQAALPREAAASFPAEMAAAYGALVSFGDAQLIANTVSVAMEMENGALVGQVAFGAEGSIAGLGFTMPNVERDTTLAENEEDITVGPKALPGVLTLPAQAAEGKVPAVVLVHGSGPNDRDETIGNARVFGDLAKGLSAQGIAVLRYDKRTYAMNQGLIEFTPEDIENMTVYDETIEDAVAAVALARADERIDSDRVFVIGHSQGGMLSGRIQQEGADANGLILLAGTMRHLLDLVPDQLEALNDGGMLDAQIELAKALPTMTEDEAREQVLLGSGAYLMWEEAQHDLKASFAENEAPMLILQGTEDANVYADRDYVLWEEFAVEYPDKDITLKLYEGIDHMFMVDGTFSPEIMSDIVTWISEH